MNVITSDFRASINQVTSDAMKNGIEEERANKVEEEENVECVIKC